MMRSMVGRRRAGGLVVAGALALGLGGCAATSKDYDKAVSENTELRSQIATLQQSLDDCEGRYAALDAQNRDLGQGGDLAIDGTNVRRGPNGEVIVDIAGDVLFDPGAAVLKGSAKKTLDGVASAIKSRYGTNLVRVEGYTDTDPIKKSKWQSNERLSGERAMAVEQYLVSKGVENGRIYFAGFGPARQQTSKTKSRRVEIVILASGG
jgi:chemotaxis protein MotB